MSKAEGKGSGGVAVLAPPPAGAGELIRGVEDAVDLHAGSRERVRELAWRLAQGQAVSRAELEAALVVAGIPVEGFRAMVTAVEERLAAAAVLKGVDAERAEIARAHAAAVEARNALTEVRARHKAELEAAERAARHAAHRADDLRTRVEERESRARKLLESTAAPDLLAELAAERATLARLWGPEHRGAVRDRLDALNNWLADAVRSPLAVVDGRGRLPPGPRELLDEIHVKGGVDRGRAVAAVTTERDRLKAQLAEVDAEIERVRARISRLEADILDPLSVDWLAVPK